MNKVKIIQILKKYKEDILPEKNEDLNKTISTERFGRHFDNFLRGLEKNEKNDTLMVNILGITCKPVKTKIMDIYYKKEVEETPEEKSSIENFLDIKKEEIPIDKIEEIIEDKIEEKLEDKNEEIREEIPVDKNDYLKIKINNLGDEINNLKKEINILKENEISITKIKKLTIEESKKYNDNFEKQMEHLRKIVELAYGKEVNGKKIIENKESSGTIFDRKKWKEI